MERAPVLFAMLFLSHLDRVKSLVVSPVPESCFSLVIQSMSISTRYDHKSGLVILVSNKLCAWTYGKLMVSTLGSKWHTVTHQNFDTYFKAHFYMIFHQQTWSYYTSILNLFVFEQVYIEKTHRGMDYVKRIPVFQLEQGEWTDFH